MHPVCQTRKLRRKTVESWCNGVLPRLEADPKRLRRNQSDGARAFIFETPPGDLPSSGGAKSSDRSAPRPGFGDRQLSTGYLATSGAPVNVTPFPSWK